METTHQLIRFWREHLHLKQEAIAIELGISQQEYSNIEAGKTILSASRLFRLAEIFGIPADDLRPGTHNHAHAIGHLLQHPAQASSLVQVELLYEKIIEAKNETITVQQKTITLLSDMAATPQKHIGKPAKNKRAA